MPNKLVDRLIFWVEALHWRMVELKFRCRETLGKNKTANPKPLNPES